MGNVIGKKGSKSGKNYLVTTLQGHKGGVNCLDINSDSSVLVTGSDDNTVRIWNVKHEPHECIGLWLAFRRIDQIYINAISINIF